jgi:GH3 auxin-responsive promoter
MQSVVGGLIKRAFTLADKVQGLGQKPETLQRRTLKRLLRKAQYTAFGKHYGFSEILLEPNIVKAFQEKIPIFDYDKMHDEWWHKALLNKNDVTWRGKVNYFALSSGTTGAPSKYIPMTDDMIRSIRKAGMKTFFASTKFGLDADFYTKKGLLIGGSTSLKDTGGYYVGDMSGINVKKRPLWLQPFVRPTDRILSIPDWNRRLDIIARNAPKWDIGYISGIPSWVQLMIEKVVAYNKVNNIHEIWPNLQVFVHGGIAFEPHRKAFDALMTKPMIYIDTYLASEGFIAFQKDPNNLAMSMILNNGVFYEFISFNEINFSPDGNLIGNPKVYNINEIKEGMDYALIISTCAGSWRYLIGDTIRFTDSERKEIIITGRTKQFLSVTGEHLSIDNMNQGIQYAQDMLKTDVKEFTVAAIETPSGFVHRWYIGCEPLIDATTFAFKLDEKLKEVNDDYTTERSAVLLQPQVEAIPPTIFLDYLKSKGKFGGQAKFPRVMKKETFMEWEAFVASKVEKV